MKFLLTVNWKSGDSTRTVEDANGLMVAIKDLVDFAHTVRDFAVTPL